MTAGREPAPGFGGRGGLGSRPGVLVVDATVAFTDPASPLACDCEEAIVAIAKLLDAARRRSLPIAFTTVVLNDTNERSAAYFLRKMPALQSIADDPARTRIDPRLAPRPGEPVIEKIFPSAFFETAARSVFQARGVDTLIVTGMSTSGCVRASVVDALQAGFAPLVPREAVADRDGDAHEANLRDLELKYADVMQLADVLAYLESIDTVAARYEEGAFSSESR
jgi:maleamate amidohydrolase